MAEYEWKGCAGRSIGFPAIATPFPDETAPQMAATVTRHDTDEMMPTPVLGPDSEPSDATTVTRVFAV